MEGGGQTSQAERSGPLRGIVRRFDQVLLVRARVHRLGDVQRLGLPGWGLRKKEGGDEELGR